MSNLKLREKGLVLEIETGIRQCDADAIDILARKSKGNIFVEVGSWKGCSAIIIAIVAKELGGHLYCVDHWRGSEGTGLLQEAKENNIYQIFEDNLKKAELWDYITPMKMDSLTASKKFTDGSIDFLFIDGDHRYSQFIQDVSAWMPKMKTGGIVCGHDCEVIYSKSTVELQERLNHNHELDFDGNYHIGIIKGLYDYFEDCFDLMPNTKIWFKETG